MSDLTFEDVARLAEARDARALWHVISRAYKERDAAKKAKEHWQDEAKRQKERSDRRAEGLVDPKTLTLTFRQLRERNVERCEAVFHRVQDWTFNDWLGAMTGELGEIANVLKGVRRRRLVLDQSVNADGDPVLMGRAVGTRKMEHGPIPDLTEADRLDLAYEMADLVTYTDLLAHWADIDLGEAVREKFNVVSERNGSDIKL